MCNSLFAEVSKYRGGTVHNNYVKTPHGASALNSSEGQSTSASCSEMERDIFSCFLPGRGGGDEHGSGGCTAQETPEQLCRGAATSRAVTANLNHRLCRDRTEPSRPEFLIKKLKKTKLIRFIPHSTSVTTQWDAGTQTCKSRRGFSLAVGQVGTLAGEGDGSGGAAGNTTAALTKTPPLAKPAKPTSNISLFSLRPTTQLCIKADLNIWLSLFSQQCLSATAPNFSPASSTLSNLFKSFDRCPPSPLNLFSFKAHFE